jgi:hypothetical protein
MYKRSDKRILGNNEMLNKDGDGGADDVEEEDEEE